MKTIEKYYDKLDEVLIRISGFALFVMMVWIFLDVILRNFFNSPIRGTLELTGEYFMVIVVYFALSYTQKEKGHLNVTLFEDKFPEGVKRIIKTITNLLAAFTFLIMAYLNFQSGLDYIGNGIRSTSLLNYPLAPAVFIITLGILIIAIRLILETIMMYYKKTNELDNRG